MHAHTDVPSAARDLFWLEGQHLRPVSPEPCPRCKGADIWPEMGPGPYGLYCRTCQWGGPRDADKDGDPDPAIWAWNREARRIAQARDMGLKVNLVQPKGDADETQ